MSSILPPKTKIIITLDNLKNPPTMIWDCGKIAYPLAVWMLAETLKGVTDQYMRQPAVSIPETGKPV